MREAVIVSQARTPIGRAYRGAFNATPAPTLAGHAIAAAVARAGIEPGEVDDVVLGAALQQGTQGSNIARLAALRAGLPVTVAGMSVDRQCASGMMAIATAAKEILHDGMRIAVAGGRREHFDGADRGDARGARPVAAGDAPGRAHADDRHGGDGGAALPGDAAVAGRFFPPKPAADGGGAGGRQVRCRDRADGRAHGGGRQRNESRQFSRCHAGQRRRQPAGDDDRRSRRAEAGARRRRIASPPATRASFRTARRQWC